LTWLALVLVLFCIGYVICKTMGDRLFVELVKVEDGWWLRSGKIGNRSKLGHGCFGMSVVEIVNGKVGSIAGAEGFTA
jgi:hypothetical protein